MLSRGQILSLLRNQDVRRLLSNMNDDEDEDDDDYLSRLLRRRAPRRSFERMPKVPNAQGTQLHRTGLFGANDYGRRRKKMHMARRMLDREHGLGDREQRKRNGDLVAQVRDFSTMLLAKLC
jgi:hypothetical protein